MIKSGFYVYKGKMQSLPKGLFLLIILFLLVLIPLILSLVIVGGVAALIIRSVSKIFIPTKKAEKIEYTDYEIIEEEKPKLN